MPCVDHAVELVFRRIGLELAEKSVPVLFERCELCLDLLVCGIAGNEFAGRILADDALGFPLVVFRILYITEDEYI